MTQPPRIATWLLKRTLSSPTRESLIGDLVQRHRHGRSALWYWRQALLAISVDVVRDIRGHRLLAMRAVAVGFTVYLLSAFPILWLSQWLSSMRKTPLIWVQNWLLETGHDSLRLWSFQLIPFWLPEGLVYIAAALSGWVVARLNSRHATGMVCAYGAAALLFESLVNVFVRLLFDGGRHPTDPNTLLVVIALLMARARAVGIPLSILVGGLCGARPDGRAPNEIAFQ